MTTTVPFEILVSTMFRDNLHFLEAMFPDGNYQDYQILVINQTDEAHTLHSNIPSVRVINTQERGLPQSRNMAIQHAIGDICLMADDDVKYVKRFDDIVVSAFAKANLQQSQSKNEQSDNEISTTVITFQMAADSGELYRSYPDIAFHTDDTISTVNGVVIAFDREKLLAQGIGYNPHFGLGATFKTANEFVFMKNVLKAGAIARFEPQIILSHPPVSSGHDQGSDRVVYGRSALHYKYSGKLSYLWVLKYVRFLVAHKYIAFSEVIEKIKVGFAGIKEYRRLLKEGLETR